MAGRTDSRRPRGVLHVIHGHGGGTEHHVRALIDASRTACRHYLAIATGDAWRIDEHRADGEVRTSELTRGTAESWPDFVGAACARFAIDLVHLHNVSGCRDGIITALAALRVPYGYTVHDLNFACPTILFRASTAAIAAKSPIRPLPGVPACAACVRASRHRRLAIAARRLVANAAFLIAPSRFAASLERYFPSIASR